MPLPHKIEKKQHLLFSYPPSIEQEIHLKDALQSVTVEQVSIVHSPSRLDLHAHVFTRLWRSIHLIESHVECNGDGDVMIAFGKLKRFFTTIMNSVVKSSMFFLNRFQCSVAITDHRHHHNQDFVQQSLLKWTELWETVLGNYQTALSGLLMHPSLANSKLLISRGTLPAQSKDALMKWFMDHKEYP